jgi:hypothetical protein
MNEISPFSSFSFSLVPQTIQKLISFSSKERIFPFSFELSILIKEHSFIRRDKEGESSLKREEEGEGEEERREKKRK